MKSKRKRQSRKPVSRERIAQASYAKAKGLLSKQAKLGNNRLSRGVAKKINAFEELGLVPTFILEPGMKRARILDKPVRTAVKIKPALARTMKEQGYEIVRGRAIIPSGDLRYRKALKEGRPAGIKRIDHAPRFSGSREESESTTLHRVQADTIEVIALDTYGISNYADLERALRTEAIDRQMKYEDEVYSFTLYGFHARGAMTFFTGEELAEYLEKYQWTEGTFDNFELVRMRQGDTLGPSPDWMYKPKKKRRGRKRVRDIMQKVRAQKMISQEVLRERNKQYSRTFRESLKSDDDKREKVLKNARDRMRAKRGTKKPRKP